MGKESSIIGVMLGQASEVQNSKSFSQILSLRQVKVLVFRYNHHDFPHAVYGTWLILMHRQV